MNYIMKPYQIEHVRKSYPPGTRIELTADMSGKDIHKGTRGTVVAVDDIGTLHTDFDNGRSLGILPNVDSFRKIDDRDGHSFQEPCHAIPSTQSARKAKKKTLSDFTR